MSRNKRNHSAVFKTKVALAAIKQEQTQSQISTEYAVHGTQINTWKKQAIENITAGFSNKHDKEKRVSEELTNELYKQIGQLKVELDWLKKSLDLTLEQRLKLIEPNNTISKVRQCELLNINRSSFYYKAKEISDYNIELMHLLDEQFTKTPFYGVLKMREYLRQLGHWINEKRVRRLLRLMGIEAIYPKPNLSKANPEHKIYPYLLRNVEIVRPDQVWSTDITYIRMKQGFVYLTAIIDWFSRYVLDWQLSTTLESNFCVETLTRVLTKGNCEIFNTDQGSQFTAAAFVNLLLMHEIKISMDGRGRALDNVFVERLWRSVKYELIYLMEFNTVVEVKKALTEYFIFYNTKRFHQALNYKTPLEIYLKK